MSETKPHSLTDASYQAGWRTGFALGLLWSTLMFVFTGLLVGIFMSVKP